MTRRKTATPSPATDTGHAKDYAAVALAYAKAAAADKQQVRHCKFVRLAGQRHLDDLKASKKKGAEFYFDPWHANDVCDFIEKLPHIEGVWETPTLTLEPAQIFILSMVFGWRRRSDGLRRFTDVYIEMARKGAKSTLTAGVVLYCLCCEGEPGPLILIGATTGAQALKVFKPARLMADRLPALKDHFGLQVWAKSITCADNAGEVLTINSKGSTQDGHNPHVAVLDELHAHKDRDLYDVIHSADGSRRNPLYWKITTAGHNIHGVCMEVRRFVAKMLERTICADHMFGIVFTIDGPKDFTPERDKGDDPYDEKVWVKANPLMPVTPSLASMRRLAINAKGSPGTEAEFFTKRLNKWMGASEAWLNSTQWLVCGDPTLRLRDFRGLDCYIGTDLSDKDDITAVVLAALDHDGRLLLKSWFYLPQDVLTRDEPALREILVLYRQWAKDRKLILTPGDFIDHRMVARKVSRLKKALGVRKAVGDKYVWPIIAVGLNEEHDDGTGFAVDLPKNANNCSAPAKELEARVKAGPRRLRHDANPVLDWMAGNAVVERRVDGSILPKKETKMSPNKIDGIDAAVNAIAPMTLPPEDDTVARLDDYLAAAVMHA